MKQYYLIYNDTNKTYGKMLTNNLYTKKQEKELRELAITEFIFVFCFSCLYMRKTWKIFLVYSIQVEHISERKKF